MFGRSAVKSPPTRSVACLAPSRTVVVTNLRRLTPATPAWRIRRAMRFLPTWRPLALSSAWMRGGPVRALRGRVDRANPLDQHGIVLGAPRPRPLRPRVIPAGGDAQHAAQRGHRVDGPALAHELEPLDGIAFVSRANQAAAFDRISRSTLS